MELRRQLDSRQRNQRHADGIYFSFTDNSRVENNWIHHVRYGLHYMYSDTNFFENNTFSDNAAGAAIMFSKDLIVRGNRFISNRGHRAYGLIFQSSDHSRLERNEIRENAVGLSFNQCNNNEVTGNRVAQNYIGLRFGSNSDGNRFSENVFLRNLHPVETGASDVSGNPWAINGVGNSWEGDVELDLDHDGINDVPHRELDLLGILRRDFPTIAFLSDSPALKLLRFAHQRAIIPGASSIEDPAPLTSRFWKIQAQQRLAAALPEQMKGLRYARRGSIPGSARVSRANASPARTERVLAMANFPRKCAALAAAKSNKSSFRRDAKSARQRGALPKYDLHG